MAKKLFETVPNYSEGRDMKEVAKTTACLRGGKNIRLLDCQTDMNHNRCVITAVGESEALHDAVIGSSGVVVQLIDMTKHGGRYPRMGAVDVVPFIPCRNTTITEADATAKRAGEAVGEKPSIPVFLYEDFAAAPHRASPVKTRKGQFKNVTEKLQDKELWTPGFGSGHIRPTAGVVTVGAKMSLTVYNMDPNMDNMEIASHIADTVKNIRGGCHFIRAIDVELKGHYFDRDAVTQVSMNFVDYEKVAIYRAFEAVKIETCRYGVSILKSEIVDVVPMQSLIDCAKYYLQTCMFGPMKLDAKKQIMENWSLEDKEEEARAES